MWRVFILGQVYLHEHSVNAQLGNNGLDIKVGLGKENVDEFARLEGFFFFIIQVFLLKTNYVMEVLPFFPPVFSVNKSKLRNRTNQL